MAHEGAGIVRLQGELEAHGAVVLHLHLAHAARGNHVVARLGVPDGGQGGGHAPQDGVALGRIHIDQRKCG